MNTKLLSGVIKNMLNGIIDFTYADIKSIFALFPFVCNMLKEVMHLMEGYSLFIHSNNARISVHTRIFFLLITQCILFALR